MPPSSDATDADVRVCQWRSQAEALTHFATYAGPTQSQQHIKPLHWYVACRLVLEGGFRPEEITPRPPFVVRKKRDELLLEYDPSAAQGGEATILGGLKTKNVDVVVEKSGIGPVLAVSCKGMTGAFRNLTNRMEETIGECTNLHITYPALVFGYLFVIRGNRLEEEAVSQTAPDNAPAARQLAGNDIAIQKGGDPVESIIRFHAALRELTGRRGIRNDVSRYEAVSLAMINMSQGNVGSLLQEFPPLGSPLRIEEFFKTLYLRYDERFVYSAPDLKKVTRRLEWSTASPALSSFNSAKIGYEARVTTSSGPD
ncbi:hypothetical protein JQ616_38965 [Bradyrhizobium tropiciagri]|uniref:hypothetical protein n=1 Tax=Bradyrhizobium tropiciagri TaxID=312253 RepID=UPI001BAC4F11|nr:hypothetical protein [Bradyrhizobium tropiciagri]MBR0900974.1 hypothetical protein [Bradyrhizobium tropiciagri]